MSFYKSKFKYLVHAHTHTHKGMIKEDHNIKWKKDQAFNVFSLIFFFLRKYQWADFGPGSIPGQEIKILRHAPSHCCLAEISLQLWQDNRLHKEEKHRPMGKLYVCKSAELIRSESWFVWMCGNSKILKKMGLPYSGGARLASKMSLVLGSTSVALVQGLSPVAWGQDSIFWDCPGGPVAKSPRSQGSGLGFEPWSGN